MARALRIQYPGAYYHVTSRGNERKAIFKNKGDRESFLSYLKSAHLRYGAVIHVYCLMNNHYHLLIETPKGNLSQIMRHINGAYTTYFNVKHRRAGHLFQGRYKAILVDADAYAGELSRYIHLNPVRAGIVNMPDQHRWSSYQYYTMKKKQPEWLNVDFILNYFGAELPSSKKKYKEFVLASIIGQYESPLNKTFASTILGDENFIEQINKKYLKRKNDYNNLPALREIKKTCSIELIHNQVRVLLGDSESVARKAAIYLCHKYTGATLKEIGAQFGISDSGITLASHRFSEILKRSRRLRKKIDEIHNQLNL